MAFVSVRDLVSNNRATCDKSDLLFSFNSGGSKGRWALCFRLTDKLMTAAKMRPGDRVDVLFDFEGGMGLIKRSTVGWKISGKSNGSTAVIQISFKPGLPSVPHASPCEYEVRKDGIYFYFPDCVRWDEDGARSNNG